MVMIPKYIHLASFDNDRSDDVVDTNPNTRVFLDNTVDAERILIERNREIVQIIDLSGGDSLWLPGDGSFRDTVKLPNTGGFSLFDNEADGLYCVVTGAGNKLVEGAAPSTNFGVLVAGGQQSTYTDVANCLFGGGFGNTVTWANNCLVFGSNNSLTTAQNQASSFATLIGNNHDIESDFSANPYAFGSFMTFRGVSSFTLAVGTTSELDDTAFALIAGGFHKAEGASYSLSTGFQTYSINPFGKYHSGGQIDAKGDAQFMDYPASLQTTDDTETPMNLQAGATAIKMNIPTDAVWRVEAKIAAVQTAGSAGTVGDARFFTVRALLKNVGGAVSVSGMVDIQTDGDGAASGWTATIAADDTNEALLINVTGEADKTINWSGKLDIVQAGFNNFDGTVQ